jgi:membrane protein implicated in regulation of membrane protease activity
MLRTIAIALLIASQLGYLIRHPRVIKTLPALIWIALTIAAILFLLNEKTLPFALPLEGVAFALLSILLSRKKPPRPKKRPREGRGPRPKTTRREDRVDRIIKKITSP